MSGSQPEASVSAIVNSSRIGELAGDRFAGRQRDGHLRRGGGAPPRPRPLGIQHALQQLQSLQPRRQSGEIAGRRVALRAAAGAIEVLLAGVGVAGLQIRDIDRAPVAVERIRLGFRIVNERDDRRRGRRRGRLNGGMPLSTRPLRTSGMILSPRTSSATSVERVRSGPVSPPIASRPWQKPQVEREERLDLRCTCSGGYVCGVTVCGGFCEAGLCCVARPPP